MKFDKLTKEDAELLSYKDLTSLILENKGKKKYSRIINFNSRKIRFIIFSFRWKNSRLLYYA